MPVEDLIREHRKFGKRLLFIGFTVSSKGRQIIVKFGKKLNIIECPTIEAAQSLADGFNATIKSRADQINEFISLMEANCTQLNLFAQPKQSEFLDFVPNAVFMKLHEECPTKEIVPSIVQDGDRAWSCDGLMTTKADAPAPTENPYEGIEEQEVPDHHQS